METWVFTATTSCFEGVLLVIPSLEGIFGGNYSTTSLHLIKLELFEVFSSPYWLFSKQEWSNISDFFWTLPRFGYQNWEAQNWETAIDASSDVSSFQLSLKHGHFQSYKYRKILTFWHLARWVQILCHLCYLCHQSLRNNFYIANLINIELFLTEDRTNNNFIWIANLINISHLKCYQ